MDKKLRQEAENLGISVDSRWSDTTLRQRIDEKKADNAAQGTAGIIGGTTEGPSDDAAKGVPLADDGGNLKTEATPKAVESGFPDLNEKTKLMITADTLKILVDPTWDENRIRAEIQQAREGRADLQVKGAVPPAEYGDPDYDPATAADKKATKVKLTHDYWVNEDARQSAGATLNLTRADALRLIAEGKAVRADPLP
jgi:hypothetical protein